MCDMCVGYMRCGPLYTTLPLPQPPRVHIKINSFSTHTHIEIGENSVRGSIQASCYADAESKSIYVCEGAKIYNFASHR